MELIKPRVSSYIGRGNNLVAEGKTPEAMKLIEEGLNYYSRRIVNAINPYAKMDAGMIVLVLRHLQRETELKNPGAKEFADKMEKCVKAPSIEWTDKVMKPNRK